MKEEKTEIQIYVEDTLSELLDAAKEGISTLIADVRRPIADDVADERRKNALESKKKAFMDAQEMMEALVKLDQRMRGEKVKENNNQDNHFKGGAAEKFAK
jgi:antitoxin (DNA-binding transcriptional repressor) of toxin-antitoxin stability system|tara:strand:- start:10184 stop:10486 length:303 start_codon:yes stop_codon:yes gene_type:complete